jgi:hypothetical protein
VFEPDVVTSIREQRSNLSDLRRNQTNLFCTQWDLIDHRGEDHLFLSC